MSRPVRVRFAPSPTGSLHIGGVRTALYNYLLAKKHGGTFILRIEDTDQNRYVPGAEDYINEALAWCGISPDEGVREGGPHAPYRQSERKHMYRQYAEQLIESGHAYYAFDTAEELDAMRERLKAAKVVSPQYNAVTRGQMKNSLTLPADEVKQRLESGENYVIRLKMPRKEEVRLQDLIRGWVMVKTDTLDDKVLMKSDGMPTYHLANVVDDYLMEISHVIRGEEWLPSAPTHVLLYRFLGWEEKMPQFAHLPLLLKPDGDGKLSKRDGEMMGFPVFPLAWKEEESGKTIRGFREDGYMPEAVINFLAMLGWNPGTHQEIFTKQELIEAFSIERVGKSGTKFDINKAKWFNQQYLHHKSPAELAQFLNKELIEKGYQATQNQMETAVAMVKDRVHFAKEFWDEAAFLFEAPTQWDSQLVATKWNAEVVAVLTQLAQWCKDNEQFTPEAVKAQIHTITDTLGIKLGKVMLGVRLGITGRGAGPDLMEVLSFLGGKQVSVRIETAIANLG